MKFDFMKFINSGNPSASAIFRRMAETSALSAKRSSKTKHHGRKHNQTKNRMAGRARMITYRNI